MTEAGVELTDVELSGMLERDYRRLLRWYPRAWRAEHGDALLGTLLDDADASDRFTVRRGEWAAFLSAGLNARLNRVVLQPVRDAAATVMLSMGTGVALALFVFWSLAPWDVGNTDRVASFGPFYDAGPVIAALWLVAFVAGALNRWWIGRISLITTVVVSALLPSAERLVAPPIEFVQAPPVVAFLSACSVLAMLGTPRAGAPLLGAVTGWALLCGAIWGLIPMVSGMTGETGIPPFMFLYQPIGSFTVIVTVLVLSVVLVAAGRWVPAFTMLLGVVPLTAGLDSDVVDSVVSGDGSSWPVVLVSLPVIAGLVVLVLASQHRVRLPVTHLTPPSGQQGVPDLT